MIVDIDLKWSEKVKQTRSIPYSYIKCSTPLETCSIYWDDTKEIPDFSIIVERSNVIGVEKTLEAAKQVFYKHIINRFNELEQFLLDHTIDRFSTK